MPSLARHYRVIAPDLRGMGDSDKPADGYDKKTMARDTYELLRTLGHSQAYIADEDIGSMVAHSFAANHLEATYFFGTINGATRCGPVGRSWLPGS
ncbi:alpha/beta fold hydrolase [Streptomyces sp. GMR22]|uniref:alpha/beta fold hydrolase n=1 Tax=Streptomyces sp. GMR22 TaxID=2759524 RepID=UPI001F41F866|nr:alpha/beta fold hydrolase [Streptomyces sp. GMR22]